jgi:hypothetical protein
MWQQVNLILFDVGFSKEPGKVKSLMHILACSGVITKNFKPIKIPFHFDDLQLKSFILYSIHDFV